MTEPPTAASPPPGMRSLPIERKLPLLILALFTVVSAISLSFSYYEIRHAAQLSAGERLLGLSEVLGSMVETQINTRVVLLRRISRDTAVIDALRSPGQTPSLAAYKALAPLTASPADTATPPELWTAEGRIIGRNMKLDLPADREQFRDEIRRLATSNDSGYVSRLHSANGHTAYLDAVPVREGDGRVVGYIVQERRFNANPRALQPFRDLIGSDIALYFRNADDKTWVQLDGTIVPAPIKAETTLDSLTVFTHGAKRELLGATRPVKGTPFLLTLERPMAEIVARPLATMRVLIVIAFVLTVLGATAAWLISRRLVRPLGELTSAAESLAHGHYSRRVEIAGNDEVGRLAAAFNAMAEEVQVSSDTSTRALTRLTESMETQDFLAEASRILSGSVSDDTLLHDLAHYCVPRLADYCSIHVADEDGSIRRIETAHRDADQLATVRELVKKYEYRVDGPGEVAMVIRTQKPLVIPQLDLASIIKTAPDAATARLIEEVGPASFMCVPLVARGRAFGAISFTMTSSGRTFWPDDIGVAMELARRTAVAIDNAVIYRRSVALRLEAEAASNAKSDFLAKMSHEIRTPINAMMGYAELLEMGISGPVTETQAKQLQRIRTSGDHLTSLVNEILDLAKIEAGRMGVQRVVGIAGEAAESAVSAIRPLATAKGVDLVATDDGFPRAEYLGDPQRVHQILTNLLSNAVKFTLAGGAVSIRCAIGKRRDVSSADGASDWACVIVHDTGVGIDADDLERIFQPFVQVETGYTRSQGGTGLGLTISRSLAQMMGGEITVESELGRGSTFTLWLPCPIRALASA